MFTAKSGAVFSGDRVYRYALWRNWDDSGKRVLFVGLNPSTADEQHNDPTIRRCIGFARDWGYGGVLVGNLFAFRATLPAELRRAQKPVGRFNRRWLEKMAEDAGMVLACWGNHGRFMGRQDSFLRDFDGIHCLAINAGGTPAHPLYLRKTLQPQPWPATSSGK